MSGSSEFLANLGFQELLDTPNPPGLSAARAQLNRLAMLTLVDPDEYGDFKVLAQAKGMGPGVALRGFRGGGGTSEAGFTGLFGCTGWGT